ncbi:MAG: hypothetical protein ACR2GG_10955 [Gemmatimonadaceae bacterium]|jgi:hypothetical protein
MNRTGKAISLSTIALLGIFLLSACGTNNASSSASSGATSTHQSTGATQKISQASGPSEKPVAPEKSPPGDIPDTQAFVTYTSQQGNYKVEVPEGWARTAKAGDASFVNKLDGMSVTLKNSSRAPSVGSVRKNQVPTLKKAQRAVQITHIQSVNTPAGQAVLIKYTSNSNPDPVTGKQVRLENNSYLFFKNGKLATLRLYAPLGADNVDQWNRISQSFRWM